MPDYPIKLGRKMGDCGPHCPMEMDKDEMHYPGLFLEWDSKYDLPESGTMVIKFKKNSETTRKGKGKERQEVSLDVLEITSVKGGPKSEKENEEEDRGETLDKLRKEVESEKEGEDEEY